MKYQKVCYYRIGEEYNWQRINDEGWTKEISEEKAKETIDILENVLRERKFVDNKNGYVYFNIHNPDRLHYHQIRIYCL